MNDEINNRPEEMLCPIINQVILEIECFETVMGCADTIVKRTSNLSCDKMRKLCVSCPYSNVD